MRSPRQARATMITTVLVVVIAQLADVLGSYAMTQPWRGVMSYLTGVTPLLALPVGTLAAAAPFLLAPRRWWAVVCLFGSPAFLTLSTLVNLFYLKHATAAAQLLCVIAAFFAGYHLRRRAAYWSLALSVVGHAVLVVSLLSGPIAMVDMIFFDLFMIILVVALVQVRDEQEATHRELEILATVDSLTGLGVRSVLHAAIERSLARSRPASLVLVDMDQFKAINDTHGHPAGDAVLKEIGQRMRALASGEQVLARLGGDEFAALIPDCSAAEAEAWAARLQAVVAEKPLMWVEPGGDPDAPVAIPMRVSVGTASHDGTGEAEVLYAAADRSLYEAKRTSRDAALPRQDRPVATVHAPSPRRRRVHRDA